MKSLIVVLLCLVVVPASAQSTSRQGGAPGVQTHLGALGYKDVQGLRQGSDGQWTGKAMRNGVPHTVTVAPSGLVTPR